MPNVLLIILDGYGYRAEREGNAIALADKPFMDGVASHFPMRTLEASGQPVGLPRGTQGNSEVGHLNLGAGRMVPQDITKIDLAIETGQFQRNPKILALLSEVSSRRGDLHIIGLVSDGGVHSHIRHLLELIPMVAGGFRGNVFIHAATDGRDTPPESGINFIRELENAISPYPNIHIATIMGRFFMMDRDKRWERVARAYRALADRQGRRATSAANAVKSSYEMGITDEFIEPAIIPIDSTLQPWVKDGDGIIFFNFRADRAREITRAFVADDFPFFERRKLHRLSFIGFTLYQEDLPIQVAFPEEEIQQTLTEVVTSAGLRVFKTAETEKYAHVTYFFNGGEENPFPGEDRELIPSPKVKTYDMKPEMSAPLVCDAVIKALGSGVYGLMVVNFANADMVGHTGFLRPTIKAIEAVDACLARIWDAKPEDFEIIITADHGNAELLEDFVNGGPHTSHTTNPVPFYILNDAYTLRDGEAALKDVAPTVLEIMGIEQPPGMTGRSLIASKQHAEK
jgi:2,3-bisphosphoglycerate-independent phosphoglycerate mutase